MLEIGICFSRDVNQGTTYSNRNLTRDKKRREEGRSKKLVVYIDEHPEGGGTEKKQTSSGEHTSKTLGKWVSRRGNHVVYN